MICGFNSFGHDFEFETVGHSQDRRNERSVVGIVGHVHHEGAVDLHHVDRKTLEIAKGGITGG